MYDILSQIAWIAFFSIAAQWLGWRLKTPAIVFLLIGGFLAGPTLNLVQPETLLGDLLNPVISLAVGIILFEGALNLNFKEIREARASIRQVILVGAPVAWLLTTLAGHYVAGLSLPVALTFGALLIVTGPTVIMPLLKNAHLKERPASILKWEGIINDPIGAVLAVLCYEFFRLQALENVALSEFFTSTVLAIDPENQAFIMSAVLILLAFGIYSLLHEILYARFFWFILGMSLALPTARLQQ